MPQVSIILPFFNAKSFLAEAIASVAAQTFSDWELLLVDDGSTDASSDIAQRHANSDPSRIFVIRHEGGLNRGLPATRNLGLQHARGELIALIDADDVWRPEKLEHQVKILQRNPTAAMVYGESEYWYDWTPGKGSNAIPPVAPGPRLYSPPTLLWMTYPLGGAGSPCPSNLMFRHKAAQEVGGFVEEFAGPWEDIAFLSKMFLQHPVYVANECWDRYRVHASSMSAAARRTGAEAQARRFYFSWLDRHLREHRIEDREVMKRYRAKTWDYRYPRTAKFYRKIRAAVRRILPTAASPKR
jgi:glycosyltransferase involved in cell wall biosynthesis